MVLSTEAQDFLKAPRRAINLAKAGSRKHALVIPAAIKKIPSRLRPDALGTLLLYCAKEEHNLNFADALVVCIARLEEDIRFDLFRSSKPHGPTPTSSVTAAEHALEILIIQHSVIIRKVLQVYHKCWFSKDGFGSTLGSSVLELHTGYLGNCLKALGSNDVIGQAMFNNVDDMRIPIRFWLATVLESKPGDVDPVVHEALWACYDIGPLDQGDFLKLLVEEKDGKACDIAALFLSELREETRKKASKDTSRIDVLIRLNLLLVCGSDPIHASVLSLCRESSRLNAATVLTKGVFKLVRRGSRVCSGSPLFAFLTGVYNVLQKQRDGVLWITDAIKAGLLTILAETEAFTSCDCLNKYDLEDLRGILHPFLTTNLVYYSVFRVAVDAMAAIGSERIKKLETSPLADVWKVFRSILLERAVFMSRLEHTITSPIRMLFCELCLKIFHLEELNKCAKCERTLYCSKACQRLDWRESDHKKRCNEIVSQNFNCAPMRTLDKFFMGHLACYDLRRHMTSLSKKIQQDYADVPLNELYLSVYYNTTNEVVSISVSPLSEKHSALSSRVRQQTEGQLICPRLVEVHFHGKVALDDSFCFILTEDYFGVPRLRDVMAGEWVMPRFRSKACYFVAVDNDDNVPIPSDPDEVGAILSFIQKGRGPQVKPGFFPLIFNYTWKDIEDASLECRRYWPFNTEGIL